MPAVVCGAGPSLEELHMPENGALVLAGGSAIAALKTIKPHLLFAIDPNEEEYRRLATHPHKEVPLVFGSRLERRVLAEHKGPRGYLVTGTGGYLESWLEQEAGIPPCIKEK